MEKKRLIKLFMIYMGIAIILSIVVIVMGIKAYHKLNQEFYNVANDTVLDEESKTKDISDVKYEEITLYKEDGTEVKLSESKDRPVMLLFWNEENEDSVKVLEKVEKMYKNYVEQIDFYMINTSKDEDKEKLKDISLEIYYDLEGEAVEKYKIEELPSMIYISEDNEVFNAKSGFTTTDSLEANLDILSNNI